MIEARSAAVLVCALGLLQGPAAAQDIDKLQAPAARPAQGRTQEPSGSDFYVLNATPLPVTAIEISRAEETSWGTNRLGTATLAPGARFLVHLPTDGKCTYDMRLTFQGGNQSEERGLDACKLAEFRVATTGAPPVSNQAGNRAGGPAGAGTAGPLHVTIVNAFRLPIQQLRVSSSATTDWGADRLGEAVIPPQGRWDLTLPRDGGCQYDLLASFKSASDQTLSKADLCANSTVRITGPRPGTVFAHGSGFRISASGHIMTNNHVVQDCGSVAIVAKDQTLPLRVTGQDPVADLAVLQQMDIVSPTLSFRDPQAPVRLAERAISIGYPLPGQLSDRVVTEGIVNALSGGRGDATQFQMQTPIQPGNSGGPVFDRFGLVIGVTVSSITRSGDRTVQNVHFAIHPMVAARFAQSLGVPIRFEPGTQEISTADVMDRNGERVLQLVCLN